MNFSKFLQILLLALFEVVLTSHEVVDLFLFELLSPLLLLLRGKAARSPMLLLGTHSASGLTTWAHWS